MYCFWIEQILKIFDGWLIGRQKLKKSAALALLSERTSSSCTETTNLLLLEPLDATERSINSLLEYVCLEVAVCTGVDIVEWRALSSNEPQDRDTLIKLVPRCSWNSGRCNCGNYSILTWKVLFWDGGGNVQVLLQLAWLDAIGFWKMLMVVPWKKIICRSTLSRDATVNIFFCRQ